MTDKNVNYEILPAGMAMDETDVNLRSYFSRMSDERLQEYNQLWTDDEVIAWDDNFRDDGVLFLVCSESQRRNRGISPRAGRAHPLPLLRRTEVSRGKIVHAWPGTARGPAPIGQKQTRGGSFSCAAMQSAPLARLK